MNRALNATKLDFFAATSSMRTTVLMYVIALVVGVATGLPVFTLGLTMVFSIFTAGLVFSVHEKNHSDRLYGILPLKKSEMILGRYLFALVIGFANIVIAIILTLLASFIRSVDLDAFSFYGVLSIGFVYFCLAVGVMFPVYLKFTFAKAYVFTSLPMYLIFLGAILLSMKTNVLDNMGGFLQFFRDHLYLAPVFGLILGLALLIVSMLIANLIYTRKEI